MIRHIAIVGAFLTTLATALATTFIPFGINYVPIAHIQTGDNFAASGSSIAVTLTNTVTPGNTVAGQVAFELGSGVNITSITDDKSNSYNIVQNFTGGAGTTFRVASYYLANITNSPKTITANLSASATGAQIVADEFSGVSSISSIDNWSGQFQSAPGTALNAITSGYATTQYPYDLIYGVSFNLVNGQSIGVGFTPALIDNVFGIFSEYQIASIAGPINAAFTESGGTGGSFTTMLALRPTNNAPLNSFYSFDGLMSPVNGGRTALYASSTNTLWFSWQGYEQVSGTFQTVAELNTCHLDPTQNYCLSWTPNVIGGTANLSDDIHDVPSIVRDAATGCVFMFYANHNTATQISYTTTPDNPATMGLGTTSLSTGTYGAQTFSIGFAIGGKLYVFWNGTGTGTSTQESLKVATATINPSTCAPTFGSATDLVDTGTTSWLLAAWNSTQVGTKIAFGLNYAPVYPTGPVTNVYWVYYDTATGNIDNVDGSTVIAPTSQPVNLTTLNASFIGYTSTDVGASSIIVDSAGIARIAVADASVSPPVLNEVHNSGSGWSSPHTVFTFPVNFPGNLGIVANASGGADVYFTDGSCAICQVYAVGAGNLYRNSVTTGNVWGSNTFIAASGAYPYFGIYRVHNAPPGARVTFSQASPLNSGTNAQVIAGNLRSYGFGDNGFLIHP